MKLALAFLGFMFLLWGIAFKLFLIGGGSSYDQFIQRREELTGLGGPPSRSFHKRFYWLADHRAEIGFVSAGIFFLQFSFRWVKRRHKGQVVHHCGSQDLTINLAFPKQSKLLAANQSLPRLGDFRRE